VSANLSSFTLHGILRDKNFFTSSELLNDLQEIWNSPDHDGQVAPWWTFHERTTRHIAIHHVSTNRIFLSNFKADPLTKTSCEGNQLKESWLLSCRECLPIRIYNILLFHLTSESTDCKIKRILSTIVYMSTSPVQQLSSHFLNYSRRPFL
jgi:hypothetical protein